MTRSLRITSTLVAVVAALVVGVLLLRPSDDGGSNGAGPRETQPDDLSRDRRWSDVKHRE